LYVVFYVELIEEIETLSDDAQYQVLSKMCDYVWILSKLNVNVLNDHILKYLCRTKAKDIKIVFTEKFPEYEGTDAMEINEDPVPVVDYEDSDDEKQEEVKILLPNLSEDDILDTLETIFHKVILNIPVETLLNDETVDKMASEYMEFQKFLLFNMEDNSYWSFSNHDSKHFSCNVYKYFVSVS